LSGQFRHGKGLLANRLGALQRQKSGVGRPGYSKGNNASHPELSLVGSIDLNAGDFAAEEYSKDMRGGSKVVTDRPDPRGADAFGLVLRFERRRGGKVLLHAPASHAPANSLANRASLKPAYTSEPADDDDFARFEQEPEERINYRQRMFMNVIALAIVTLLLGAGVWIAGTITELQKDQDCILQGRSNCAPLELPMPVRE
jgi:hypothetical protein